MLRLVFSLVFVLVLLAVLLPLGARAESPALERLAQESALYCVAFEAGVPAEAVALAKIRFDTRYGASNQIVSVSQWTATQAERMQYFTDWLGVPAVTRDGAPLKWCARLLDAQARIAGE